MSSENLLARIQKIGVLTSSEAKIADYFRREYPKVALDTATAISQKTNTSKATVVRFISRLNYGNFIEFQNQLKQELVSRLESPIARYPSTKRKLEQKGHDFLGQNIVHIMENLRKTDLVIDRELFIDTAKILANEKRQIFIMGQKASFGLAHNLWILLKYLRKKVFLISGQAETITEELMDATPRDVLIVISHRRYANQTVKTANFFSDIGAHIIALVDTEDNPFSQLAEIQMVIPTFGLSIFDSSCATLAFIESLVIAVAHLREDKIYKRFESSEKLIKHFKTFSDDIVPKCLKGK